MAYYSSPRDLLGQQSRCKTIINFVAGWEFQNGEVLKAYFKLSGMSMKL
jgi:hypothetical protein